ncbi:hypothetical protein JB92DRAFT_2810791 [Gautieria morchelliformis]|nr:hypothetical protein JB92DRAFT_2810791 [Gautieria morchelliformis]
MPIPPPQCSITTIALPPLPHDPPDVTDVCKATLFADEVRAGRRHMELGARPTDEDVCSATLYRARILSAYSAVQGVPILGDDLVAIVMGRLDVMEGRMDEIGANIDAVNANLRGHLDALQKMVGYVRILATRSYNLTCGSGLVSRFAIMPLPNGQEPPANLPCLENVQRIRNLSQDELIHYINAYGLQHRQSDGEKRQAISAHIGCTVDL